MSQMRVRRRLGAGKWGRLGTFSLKEPKKTSYEVSSVAKSVLIGQNNNTFEIRTVLLPML